MAIWAGADLIDMEACSSTRRGWSGRSRSGASWSPRGSGATAGCCATATASGSCSTTWPTCSGPRRPTPRPRVTAGTRTTSTTAGPPSCCPRRGGPIDQQRGQGGPGQPPRWRLLGHRLPPEPRVHPPPPALDVPPVHGAGRGRHHGRVHGGGPDLPLHDGRGPGERRYRGGHGGRAVRRRRGGRGHARLQSTGGQLPVRPAGLRPPGRHGGVGLRGGPDRRAHGRPQGGRRRGGRGPGPVRSGGGREPLRPPARPPGDHADPGGYHPHRARAGRGPGEARRAEGAGHQDRRQGRSDLQPGMEPGH